MTRDELPFPVFTGAVDRGEIERISARDVTPEEFAERHIKKGMAVVLTDAMMARPDLRRFHTPPHPVRILSRRRLSVSFSGAISGVRATIFFEGSQKNCRGNAKTVIDCREVRLGGTSSYWSDVTNPPKWWSRPTGSTVSPHTKGLASVSC